MSFTYLLAQGEESSAECFSDIDQSVLSRLTSIADAHCFSDNATASFHGSQSGMTSEHSTGDHGEASQTSSVEAFHVRTSQQRERAQESQASVPVSGVRWHELSEKYDRDTHSWRTHRCLWDEDLPWSSVILPNWGSMRDGVLFQRPTPERLTSESEYGFWPTPTTKGIDGGSHSRAAAKSRGMWPTPRANDAEKRGVIANDKRNGLPAAVMYATPTARDWKSGKASQATMERNSRPLSEQVGGLLNPNWVEWLMGWPIGFSALEPLEMDKFQQWQRSHGEC